MLGEEDKGAGNGGYAINAALPVGGIGVTQSGRRTEAQREKEAMASRQNLMERALPSSNGAPPSVPFECVRISRGAHTHPGATDRGG